MDNYSVECSLVAQALWPIQWDVYANQIVAQIWQPKIVLKPGKLNHSGSILGSQMEGPHAHMLGLLAAGVLRQQSQPSKVLHILLSNLHTSKLFLTKLLAFSALKICPQSPMYIKCICVVTTVTSYLYSQGNLKWRQKHTCYLKKAGNVLGSFVVKD